MTLTDLIDDQVPGQFSVHPDLPPLTAERLKGYYQSYLEGSDTATATVLARLAASEAAKKLSGEIQRTNRRIGGYLYQMALLEIWHNPDLRPELANLLKKYLRLKRPSGITWRQVRGWLESARRYERWERELIVAHLLANLAERATRLDEGTIAEIERRKREFLKEKCAAELLRKGGCPDQAAVHTRRAVMHLWYAQRLREGSPNAGDLLNWVRFNLSWLFVSVNRNGKAFPFLGHVSGIAAKLVAAALNQEDSSRWRNRPGTKSSTKLPATSIG